MIKLTRPDKPVILLENEAKWTKNLLDAIVEHKGYKNIPAKEKEKLLKHYRNKKIQDVLFESSHKKCSFCECLPGEGGDIQIEHFNPKSIYPTEAFQWENLLPICLKCNRKKSNHDTKAEELINPYLEDPSDYVDFVSLKMIPKINSKNGEKSLRSIEKYDLNRTPLYRPRGDLLVSLHEYESDLKKILKIITKSKKI